MTDWFDSLPYNLPLILLVILLAIWMANAIPAAKVWNHLKDLFAELMGGLLYGLLLGYALTFHRYAGILTLGSAVAGLVLVLNANNKVLRVLACITAVAIAALIYLGEWSDFSYLRDSIFEDFQ